MKRGLLAALVLIFAVGTCCAQSETTLSSEKIKKLLPRKLDGYRSGESKSRMMSVGTLTYSVGEKSFNSKKQTIKFLLYDYVKADIMYRQATQKWNTFAEVVTDSVISHSFNYDNCTGWETHNYASMRSQILVGIRNRFYLNVEAVNVNIESLRYLVRELMINSFSTPD